MSPCSSDRELYKYICHFNTLYTQKHKQILQMLQNFKGAATIWTSYKTKGYDVTRLDKKEPLTTIQSYLWPNQTLLGLSDVALLDKEIIDFACLVDVDLDQCSGLGQPQAALPSALIQQGLLIFQVGPGHQPHHLA